VPGDPTGRRRAQPDGWLQSSSDEAASEPPGDYLLPAPIWRRAPWLVYTLSLSAAHKCFSFECEPAFDLWAGREPGYWLGLRYHNGTLSFLVWRIRALFFANVS